MANVERRKSKSGKISYRVKIRLQGYPTQSATFDRKVDADDWARETEAKIRAGRHLPNNEAKKHTLSDLIDRYIKTEISEKKSRRDQQRQLEWWRTEIGNTPLSNVTPSLITECRDKLKEGKRSNATVNRYLAALSHTLTVAEREWEWIDTNPLRKVSKLKEPRGRIRFLSNEELERLLSACQQSPNPELYTVVLLSLSTGARKMEIWGLTWDQIDFAREVIVLHETKNQERRVLPLKGEALELIRKKSMMRSLETNLLFPSPKHPLKPVDFRSTWEKALKLADIQDFRWHDLRHTAASYLAMSGATHAEIAAVLGHKTLSMVKRYAHLSEAHTANVVERMTKHFLAKK